MTFIFIAIVLVQLFYWHYFYGFLLKDLPIEPPKKPNQSVSILICAKNEIDNLKRNLPTILDQTYINYSIVVADDFSSDGTTEFLKQIDNEKGILNAVKVKENKRGKKAALGEAIASISSKWILLTDADCRPSSEQWVSSMISSAVGKDKTIILGYSPYVKDTSYISKWTHFEAWITGLQYLSYAKRGIPYMGVGRNLLYLKDLVSMAILNKYDHLASGDDDLTVMQIADNTNTAINLDPHSFVMTSAPLSFAAYFIQKTRHFSTATSYLWKHKFLLALYSSSQMLFFFFLFVLLWEEQFFLALSFYLFRLLLIAPLVVRLRTILKAEFSLLCFPIYDLGLAFYYLIFSFAALFPQKTKW